MGGDEWKQLCRVFNKKSSEVIRDEGAARGLRVKRRLFFPTGKLSLFKKSWWRRGDRKC